MRMVSRMSLITEEEQLLISVSGQRIHKKSVKKLEEVQKELQEVLPVYDRVELCYGMIRSCFGFCGYSHSLILECVRQSIDEMLRMIPSLNETVKEECRGTSKDPAAVRRSYMTRKWKRYNALRKALHRLSERIEKDAALGFIRRLESDLMELAEDYNIPVSVVNDIYRLCGYRKNTDVYYELEEAIFITLYEEGKEDLYEIVRDDIRILIEGTVRASSLVENTNQKIRPYINAKHVLSGPFCELIQLYINTRKYRRSIKGRTVKSPAELMMGRCHPPFLELLGYV